MQIMPCGRFVVHENWRDRNGRTSIAVVCPYSGIIVNDRQEIDLTQYLQPIGRRTEIISAELLRLPIGASVDRGNAPELALLFEETTPGVANFYGLTRISAFPGHEGVQLRTGLGRWREIADPFVHLHEGLRERSPLRLNGIAYDIFLVDIEHDPPNQALDVHLAAQHRDDRQTATIHTDLDRLRRPEFAERAAAVLEAVLRGDLPPGMVDYL